MLVEKEKGSKIDLNMNIKMSPKDFFLHLASIVSLYVSAISLLALIFNVVDIAFPDQLNYYYDPYSAGLRFAIASLIIVFPLYLFLTWLLNREYENIPEKRDFAIRKWLTTFTLFITGAAIIVDLVVLLNTFLGGEITTRFIIKVIAVLVVAAIIFTYYIRDLRSTLVRPVNERRLFRFGSMILVLAVLAWGFSVLGSPMSQRLIRFDREKVNDLQNIQWQIVNYFQTKGALPNALSELNDALGHYNVPVDKQTGNQYRYERGAGASFTLCATFNRPSRDKMDDKMRSTVPVRVDDQNWQHGAGDTCFKRTIDPERYPVRPKI